MRIFGVCVIQGGAGGVGRTVKISSVKEDRAFVEASRRFEEAMASKGFREFCQEKEAGAKDAHERRVWQFMQIIFEKNARNQLLAHLGFDGEAVARSEAYSAVRRRGGCWCETSVFLFFVRRFDM